MNDLHVVSENDELSTRNGSAVLRVALELQDAAKLSGKFALIGGGKDKLVDLPGIVGVLESRRINGRFRPLVQIFDKAAKFFLGFSVQSPRIFQLEGTNFSHVYCHNQPWIGAIVRRKYVGSRVHLYVHNRVMVGASPISIRRALMQFDSVICVSDFIRLDLMKRAGFKNRTASIVKFTTVFSGVDYDKYDQPLSKNVDEVDIVYVGRIIPEKGTHILAMSIQSISHDLLDAVRVVGGEGFLPRESLSEYELGVVHALRDSSVRFTMTGPVPPNQIPDLINSAKVIVVPSICCLLYTSDAADE